MGIYKQPGKWECGPFALKHALLMHGVLASEWEIVRLAGASPDGTDETQLEGAARHYGFELPTVRKQDAEAARRELVEHLGRGIPCLLCVDGWDHWVTAVHEENGQFIILDSEKPEVIQIIDWPRLQKLWVYHDEDDLVGTLYDIHPLVATGEVKTPARFSLERANYLREPDNQRVAQLWDVYVEDLISICCAEPRAEGDSRDLGEFLRGHSEMLLDQLEHWHGQLQRGVAARVLERMSFVADTYGLEMRQGDEARSIAAVSMILALWSAGEFGVEPVYRRVPVRKIR
jgi:hypothetical protein